MLVADNTAIVYLHLEGEWHNAAVEAYRSDPDWLTVPLWRYEFLNVLLKKRRAGHFNSETADVAFRQAAERLIPLEHSPDHFQALEIALRHSISAYDACYVTLAQELNVRLLTEDKELLTKFPDLAVSLKAFGQGSKS